MYLPCPLARHRVTITRFHPLISLPCRPPRLSLVRLRVSPPYIRKIPPRQYIYMCVCAFLCFSFIFTASLSSRPDCVTFRPCVKTSIVLFRHPEYSLLQSASTSSLPFPPPSLPPSSVSVFLTVSGFCRF